MPRALAPKPQIPPHPQTTIPGTCIPNCLHQYSLHTAYTHNLTLHGPSVTLLPSYGDHAYALTPRGTPILVLDSKIYRFDEHNMTNDPPPETAVAFAMIALFRPENRANNNGDDTLSNLRRTFSQGRFGAGGSGKNRLMVFAVRGAFSFVDTTKGRLENVQGTIFGFALPKWLEGISFSGSSGVRCCFLSGCHRRGGEVVDYLSIAGTFVEWATSEHFRVGLPRDGRFGEVELFSDVSGAGQSSGEGEEMQGQG